MLKLKKAGDVAMWVFGILAGLFVLFVVLMIYALCVSSSRADKRELEMYDDYNENEEKEEE